MSDAVDVSLLADPVWALLDSLSNVNTFDGEVVSPPLDADGRVHAYAVYYPGPGRDHALLNDAAGDSLDWGFQVTCVGGDRTRALWCVERVRSVLTGARLSVAGQQLVIHEESSTAPLRRDEQVQPPRLWMPLLFTLSA